MQPSAAARFALTILLGLIGAFLWVLPTAQAESVRGRSSVTGMVASAAPAQVPLPDTPLTVAANGPIRLTIGAADPAPSGMTTVGSGKGPNCTGPVGETSTVVVPLGKSTLVNLGEPVRQRTVGNPSIVQTMLVSPQTLYLLGSDIGTTNMIVQGKGGSCSVIDVVVGADPAGLQQTIVKLMPNERGVQVTAAGDALVLTGTVTDATVAERIIELAHAFTLRPNAALPPPTAHGGPLGIAGAAPAPAAGANGGDRSQRVINMMHIAAPQQVMLEVKVAEVSKTLIDQLGAQANLQGSIGTWSFGLLAQFLSGGLGIAAAAKSNNLPLNLAIDAQKTDQLVKILAEPNLMAISGQEASFLAGGKVFIPVPQSNGTGGTTITLQEELFGVGLTFTPTVLENGRINLKVAPEVSELSPTGVAVTAGGVNSTAILPLITTRRATTTLQVYDGQSFAIGGLMKSNVTGTLKALPGIGEVPVLGALFRSTNFQEDKTELVFVVTPRLAKPLPRNYPLPTDTFANVDEAKVYATGNMEGTRPAAPAVPASAAPAATPVAAPGAAVPVPVAPQRPASPAAVGSAVPPLNLEVVPVAVPVPSAAPTPRTEPAADQAGSSTISSAPSAARQAASVGLRTEPVLAMRGAMDPQPPHSPGAHASPAEIAIQNGAASELGKDRQPASPATP